MNQTFNLLFYPKKSKTKANGTVPLYLRITIDGKSTEISAKRSIRPEMWDSKMQRLSGRGDELKAINSYLKTFEQEVYNAHHQAMKDQKPVTSSIVKCKVVGMDKKSRMLIPIFKAHNTRIEALVPSGEYAQGTVERYITSLSHTIEFIQWKYNTSDIALDDIDFAFIKDYDFYLRSERNCGNNTTIKYLRNFQKIINECLANEWIAKDPFLKYKPKLKTVERDFLNEDEIQKMYAKIFVSERLSLVRDIFIFSCFTGLAYIDVKNLTPTKISIGIDGSKWIFTKREKTEGPSHIPLLPIAEVLIEKYKNHPRCLNKDVVFPILSNQKMNSYLKEIADVCGINKELTFHIARHTFATTVTLSNGVPLESVSKMLGHKSWKSTQIYAKVLDTKVSKDMNELRTKYDGAISQCTNSELPQQFA